MNANQPVAGQNGPSSALTPVSAGPRSSERLSGPQRRRAAVRPAMPTRAQLLNLADRSERHTLTPVEAQMLRAGVDHLAGQMELAGLTIRRLTEELTLACRERDAARREAAESSPTLVACPYCGVPAGTRCRPMRGALLPRTPHTARLDAASRWLFQQALGEAS